MKWEKVKLGKYVEILSGFAFKSKDFLNCGVPVIKIKNITQEGVTLEDVSYISKELADKNEKYHLNYNDILIALTGSHINQMSSVVGRIARVKYHEDSLLNQRVGKVFAKDSKLCDIDYVYYFLSQDYIKISLASKAGGAANQANISPNDVKSLTVRWPDIETQHRIANILSAYDDLIENNQKQIKLMEEAAQRLYKEWFVDLRFPGHENTKIVDGVPEEWRKFPLEEIAPVVTGKKDANYGDKGGNYPFFTCSQETITAPGYSFDTSAVILAGNGDFNVKLYRGKFEAYQRTYVLAPFDHSNLFNLYFTVQDNMEALAKGASGSTIKFLTKGMLQKILVLTADKKILDKFNDYEENIQQKVEALKKQVEDLTEIRNRLLPKLMSGEVEV